MFAFLTFLPFGRWFSGSVVVGDGELGAGERGKSTAAVIQMGCLGLCKRFFSYTSPTPDASAGQCEAELIFKTLTVVGSME